MSDIFISYAREDREIAERLAGALTAENWQVWWDFELGAGDSFRETIEAELEAATVVIVLWSPHSVRSSFVRDEASRAHGRSALVPLVVGGLALDDLPLGFGELHTQDLTGWKGDVRDARYARVVAGLRKRFSVRQSVRTREDHAQPAGETGLAHAAHPAAHRTSDADWTWSRTLLLVLLLLDITVVALWLLVYSRHYANVAMVVVGVWAAIMAALGRFRIRTKETGLSEFLGLPPVKATIATYSCLILSAVPLFALAELPVHRVDVIAPVDGGPASVDMIVQRGDDTTHVHAGPAQWRFYARRGQYVLRAAPEGYDDWNQPFRVGWFTLSQRIDFTASTVAVLDPPDSGSVNTPPGNGGPTVPPDSTPVDPDPVPPRLGTLRIGSNPPGVEVFLAGRSIGVTPITVSRAPGTYTIELRRRHVDDSRFGYHTIGTVSVEAGAERAFDPILEPIELPTLLILPRPDARGAVFYLDSVASDRILGQVAGTSRAFSVFPGDRVVLKKLGDAVTECSRVVLVAGRQEQIIC